MSGMELTKIVVAILLASLIAATVNLIADILYKPNLHPEPRGYALEITKIITNSDTKPIIEQIIDIAELMKNANAELGRDVAKKCLACHSFDKNGINKVGPPLWNIVDNEKAKIANYKYSPALSNIGGSWDEETLFHFLNKPSQYAPGTKMNFIGLNKPQDIANVIMFLKKFVHD
jgi:cytochrome c